MVMEITAGRTSFSDDAKLYFQNGLFSCSYLFSIPKGETVNHNCRETIVGERSLHTKRYELMLNGTFSNYSRQLMLFHPDGTSLNDNIAD